MLTTGSSSTDTIYGAEVASSWEPVPGGVGKPDCRVCHGLGYIRLDVPVGHLHFGKLFPCPCRMAEIESHRRETWRSVNNLEALEWLKFATFKPEGNGLTPDRQQNLRSAYELALAYAQHPEGWLVLVGGYGCGKTHLAAAIANHVLDQGIVPLFVTVPDLLDHLRAAFAPTSPDAYTDRFEQVRTTRLLILDDLGTESATPWALEKLFQLLNYRYMNRLPTVITTNHDLEHMDGRLRSRLSDPVFVEVVRILAPDFRVGGADLETSRLNTLSYYRDLRLDTFDLRHRELGKDQIENLTRALTAAREFATNPEGWIVFTGMNGVGKTHLAAAIANEHQDLGKPALFVVVPDLLDYLRASFSPQSSVSLDRRFEEVRRAPLLVLDDLGTESATPWAKEKLFQLINFRYVAKLPTIVTMSQRPETLDPKLAIRFMDMSRCTVFEILAPPYMGGFNPGKRGLPKSGAPSRRGAR